MKMSSVSAEVMGAVAHIDKLCMAKTPASGSTTGPSGAKDVNVQATVAGDTQEDAVATIASVVKLLIDTPETVSGKIRPLWCFLVRRL